MKNGRGHQGSQRRPLSISREQSVGGADEDFETAGFFSVRERGRRGDEKIPALRVEASECVEGGGIERFGIPFALDRVHIFPRPGDHEVHFATGFVTPVADGKIGQVGLEIFQDEVLPEEPEVF